MSGHSWPLSSLHVGRSGRALPDSPPLAQLATMTIEEKDLVREAWIAAAYASLPDLTPEQKRKAQDKALAREAAWWRVQFREMELDRDHHRAQAAKLREAVDELGARLAVMLKSFERIDSAESTAVEATG